MSAHEHGRAHGRAHGFDTEAEAARLEREAEGLLDEVERAAALLAGAAGRRGVDVRRVLDIGCGPGVATCVLAQQFRSATVVAVDSSPTMLEHAAARAARLGPAARVETRRVDLPDAVDTLGRADVAWASMVLHHVGEERAVLRELRELLVPSGLLAVVEHAPMRDALHDSDFVLLGDEPLGDTRRLSVAAPA